MWYHLIGPSLLCCYCSQNAESNYKQDYARLKDMMLISYFSQILYLPFWRSAFDSMVFISSTSSSIDPEIIELKSIQYKMELKYESDSNTLLLAEYCDSTSISRSLSSVDSYSSLETISTTFSCCFPSSSAFTFLLSHFSPKKDYNIYYQNPSIKDLINKFEANIAQENNLNKSKIIHSNKTELITFSSFLKNDSDLNKLNRFIRNYNKPVQNSINIPDNNSIKQNPKNKNSIKNKIDQNPEMTSKTDQKSNNSQLNLRNNKIKKDKETNLKKQLIEGKTTQSKCIKNSQVQYNHYRHLIVMIWSFLTLLSSFIIV
ncbi:uncharacterized protein ASCRUDRAFT_141180 [Ascoidea rubescens DSM 1968]|uniref:Uncharacterized protein n=1 Tax=Ascoidea rubescens DSM 1968 TaxID=1344418 RepID=A0A1D2VIJ0_9ASCO|nr:hypothetical protein ASCRUDRAFT_141180 [Ascoidea rubescens DSM 1968]ODV61313.1 hypothetical protein ASCRUDRAFT_141180 [Ascoidea rubescens DSM 1968]